MTSIIAYPTKRELLRGLQNDNVAKIWLFDCNNETDQEIRIVHILSGNPVIGADVKLVGYRKNLQKYLFECLDQWAEEEHESCYEDQVASRILKKRGLECQPNKVIVFGNWFDLLSY